MSLIACPHMFGKGIGLNFLSQSIVQLLWQLCALATYMGTFESPPMWFLLESSGTHVCTMSEC